MNHVIVSGNLGRKPVVKDSRGGVRYGTFDLAVDEAYKDKDGKRAYRAQWFRVVAFERLTDVLLKLERGNRVVVRGSLHASTYVRRDETKGYSVEIHAYEIEWPRPKNGEPATVEPDADSDAFAGEPDEAPDLDEAA